jgi:hypothetical protein
MNFARERLWPSPRKLLLTAVAIALATWLLLEGSPTSRRKRAIEHALAAGSIGGLPPDEMSKLAHTLQDLAAAAGCDLPVALNEPFRPHTLNIFTTTPKALSVTGCDRGNAVYDADLDAVFIDHDVVNPVLASGTFGSVGVRGLTRKTSASDTYLRCIVLHELGHRALHRQRGGLFDRWRTGRDGVALQREAEADDFALEKMSLLYEDLPPGPRHPPADQLGGPIKLPRPDLVKTAGDRMLVDLAAMVYEMNQAVLFTNSSFSPFSRAKDHPVFVDRTYGFLRQGLQKTQDEQIRAYMELAIEYLTRIRDVGPLVLAEIRVEEPIHTVTFDEAGVLLLSDTLHLSSVPYVEITEPASDGPRVLRASAPQVLAGLESVRPIITSLHCGLNSSPLLFIQKRGVYVAENGHWKPHVLPGSRGDPKTWSYLWSPPQPSHIFMAVTMDGPKGTSYELFRDNRGVAYRSPGSLSQELSTRGAPANSSIALERIDGNGIDARVLSPSGTVAGLCTLDGETLALRSFEPLDLTKLLGESATYMVAVRQSGQTRRYAVGDTFVYGRPHNETYELRAWQIGEDAKPRLVHSVPLTLEKLPRNASHFDWLTISHPAVLSCRWIPSAGVACTEFLDSVYFFDPVNERITPLFHPAASYMSVAANGLVAFFAPGSQKCFIVQPAKGRP